MKRARWLVLLAPVLGVAQGCDRPSYTYSDSASIVGGPVGGTVSVAGTASIGGMGPAPMCQLDRSIESTAIFRPQALSNQFPVRPELYLQVTDDEAEALKKGGPLVAPPASGAPQPVLASLLDSLSTSLVMNSERWTLVKTLQQRFKATRSTWPNPWALRLVDHAGTEHMTPVLLRLKDDALIVRITDGLPIVLDMSNAEVSLPTANAHPEKIAAVYYMANDSVFGIGLSSPCETGLREFALGNEAMVESFELGTQAIADRMSDDLELLTKLFNAARVCTSFDPTSGMSFHSSTVCQAWDFFDPSTEYSAYQWSLSNPVELYKPTAQNLAALIEALQDDTFEPDPFTSAPHPSPLGDGGAGGANAAEGGASAGGAGGAGG